VYFCLIGAGFMLVEMGLIQRLAVVLGHPVYALGVLLFGIIASAGAGSFLSEVLPVARRPWIYALPLVTGAVVALSPSALRVVSVAVVGGPLAMRIAGSLLIVLPIGLLLGFFFPTGMRFGLRTLGTQATPWFWALNGVFGVVFSALSVLIAISYGISVNLYLGAACYFAVTLTLPYLMGPAR
jgi:hypothetical protein